MQNAGAIVEGTLKRVSLSIMDKKINLVWDTKAKYIVISYLKLKEK